MGELAVKSTKWTLDIATRLIKANIRLHNLDALRDDMAIIYVVNHFTRIETVLLPYVLHKHTGKEIWSLAAAELFQGRIGKYLLAMGNVSTKDPDRDRIVVRALLNGEHPWIIFPEGGMIKDKKVVDADGMFRVYNNGQRRPPHTGAAVLALRAEYYRQRLACFRDRPNTDGVIKAVLERFGLESVEQALSKRTVLVPVNITYFPSRSQDNVALKIARAMAKDLSRRAVEELSFEGTVLSKNTDVDITLGDPIAASDFLQQAPDCPLLLKAVQDNLAAMEEDPASGFNDAARRLMIRYMADIYRNTTINYDHVFATLIRYQRSRKFTERAYRNRVFLCVHQIKELGFHRLHPALERTYRDILYEEKSPMYDEFLALCVAEGVLRKDGDQYAKASPPGKPDFHTMRSSKLATVIMNEVEPLTLLTSIIQTVAQTPRTVLSSKIRKLFIDEDSRIFEEDYAAFQKAEETKPPEVGRPFLLLPPRIRAGIVLVHGYMSAPLEIRALADYLFTRGYAVYGVRLKGHGTSPEDLAGTKWEEWYESVNRGYAVIKSLTDDIILGGFSTGGVMAMLGAGRKRDHIRAVFSINAPLHLRNYMARFASTFVSMNNLLARIKRGSTGWEFAQNSPENRHINYFRNPVAGVKELGEAMEAMEAALKDVCVPALVIQGYRDPVVDPSSGEGIFRRIGSQQKELVLLNYDRHGVVNGEGSLEVFERVDRFLQQVGMKAILPVVEEEPDLVQAPKVS